METKDQLIKTIKEWVKIDNELKTLQQEQLKRKNEKKNISKELIEVMKKNNIDCFDINSGQIVYNKQNIKKPITKKDLLKILNNYYKNDPDCDTKAKDVNDFILENRETVVKENILLKQAKTPATV